MRSHETHGYCPTSQSDAAAVSRRRSAAHPHGATLLLSPRGAMLPKQTERYYFVSRECNASPAHGGTIRRANRTERSPMLPNLPERPTLLSSLTAALCCFKLTERSTLFMNLTAAQCCPFSRSDAAAPQSHGGAVQCGPTSRSDAAAHQSHGGAVLRILTGRPTLSLRLRATQCCLTSRSNAAAASRRRCAAQPHGATQPCAARENHAAQPHGGLLACASNLWGVSRQGDIGTGCARAPVTWGG